MKATKFAEELPKYKVECQDATDILDLRIKLRDCLERVEKEGYEPISVGSGIGGERGDPIYNACILFRRKR